MGNNPLTSETLNTLSTMSILGANYPTRSYSSSSMGTTTVAAKQSYKVNFVTNTGTKSDVYSGGKTSIPSTYQIPKKSTASTSTSVSSTTNTSLQKTMSTITSAARTTTLQNCIPCGYGKK